MSLERELTVGACNDPQPYNWRNACRLRPNHPGAHRTPSRTRGYDLTWPTERGPVSEVRAIGRRNYVRPTEIGR